MGNYFGNRQINIGLLTQEFKKMKETLSSHRILISVSDLYYNSMILVIFLKF